MMEEPGFSVIWRSTLVLEALKELDSWALQVPLDRGGGTGPADPANAGPIFS